MIQFSKYWKNTKTMPWPLSMFFQGGMIVTPILLIFLLLPIQDWTVNGDVMSYAELWKSGAGFIMALFLSLGLFGFWGIAAKKANARWLLVCIPIAPIIFGSFVAPSFIVHGELVATVFQGALASFVFYAYLFRVKSVSKYFFADIA